MQRLRCRARHPPHRTERLVTIPPSEITATSLVTAPMSTTMLPVGSSTGKAGPNRSCHRLLHQIRLSRACLQNSLLDSALFHLCNTGRNTYNHARLHNRTDELTALIKAAQHRLRNIKISDNSILHRTDCDNVARRPANHVFAALPTAKTLFVALSIATTDGSRKRFPLPLRTSVFVPRSIQMSFAKLP